MQWSSPRASVFCPSGRPAAEALGATRQLGVVAHADDLEIAAIKGILDCYDDAQPGFCGVVVCDGLGGQAIGGQAVGGGGTGSRGVDAGASLTPEQYRQLREREQQEAAKLGRYAAVVCLQHSSAHVRSRHPSVSADLDLLLAQVSPDVIYTHNPIDAHDTHVAVVVALIEALKRSSARKPRVIGCEVWRDLDWLPEAQRVTLDVSAHASLQGELIRVFASQTSGKRYDLAALGRRQAHATFRSSDRADAASGVVFGVDLTSLLAPDAPTLQEFSLDLVDAFRRDVEARFARLTGPGT